MATDEQVMKALRLIEAQPSRNWTVESLAGEIGMGRSAFALRFKSLLGDTPMNYLLRTRMQLAAAALRDGRSMAAIAHSVGYLSRRRKSLALFLPADAQLRRCGDEPGVCRGGEFHFQEKFSKASKASSVRKTSSMKRRFRFSAIRLRGQTERSQQ